MLCSARHLSPRLTLPQDEGGRSKGGPVTPARKWETWARELTQPWMAHLSPCLHVLLGVVGTLDWISVLLHHS